MLFEKCHDLVARPQVVVHCAILRLAHRRKFNYSLSVLVIEVQILARLTLLTAQLR